MMVCACEVITGSSISEDDIAYRIVEAFMVDYQRDSKRTRESIRVLDISDPKRLTYYVGLLQPNPLLKRNLKAEKLSVEKRVEDGTEHPPGTPWEKQPEGEPQQQISRNENPYLPHMT